MSKTITIPCVANDGIGFSIFAERKIDLHGNNERMLSEQISALNCRLRENDASYSSAWHVAGDSTLLVILAGTLRIELRSGETCEFSLGEMFVAEDYLAVGVQFDSVQHGHRAVVVGDELLSVIHIKLEKR